MVFRVQAKAAALILGGAYSLNRGVIGPPPLKPQVSPARTYVWAVIMLLPAMMAGSFALWVLNPKVEQLWNDAGLAASKARWLISLTHAFADYFWIIVAALILIFMVLELHVKSWGRFRRPVVF